MIITSTLIRYIYRHGITTFIFYKSWYQLEEKFINLINLHFWEIIIGHSGTQHFFRFVDLLIFINRGVIPLFFLFLTSPMIVGWNFYPSYFELVSRYVHRINFPVGKNDGNRYGRNVSRENFIRKLPEIFHSRISRASLSRKIILQMIKKKRWSFWNNIRWKYIRGKDRSKKSKKKKKNKVIFSDDL